MTEEKKELGSEGSDGKIRIEVNASELSEKQKAQILARGGKLSGTLFFEMSLQHGLLLAAMEDSYSSEKRMRVFEDRIVIGSDQKISYEYGYNEKGEWAQLINDTYVARTLATAYADGEIELGGNVDQYFEKFAELLHKKYETKRVKEQRDTDEKAKEERKRPAREAAERQKREAEEKEQKARDEAAAKAKAEADAREKAEREKKLAWISENGSERLKKGIELGYNCTKLYAEELGASLIADASYEYDYRDTVTSKDRSCPSLDAIHEIERLEKVEGVEKAVIMWLPRGLNIDEDEEDRYYDDESSGCEAVCVSVQGTPGWWYKTF